jgi:hypothetical protein
MRSNRLSAVMPAPDLIRGLSRASASFLQGFQAKDVMAGTSPAITAKIKGSNDRNSG